MQAVHTIQGDATPGCSVPHGVYQDRIAADAGLIHTLRTDDMERYAPVPKTVMVNPWFEDLNWIIVDRTYPKQIEQRLQLLLKHEYMVIGRLPGAQVQAAERELLGMVADYLLHAYPEYFRREGNLVLSGLTGLAIDIGPRGADPMVAVALLASEDMLLLLPEKRENQERCPYMLTSGALLFPNHWSLCSHFNQPEPQGADPAAMAAWRIARNASLKAARLGKSPYAIHDGHVSHYMQHFAERVDLFFSKMEPGMRTWRRNWGPRMTDELFLHSDRLPENLPPATADNWERYGYLRSEHETFTKLPGSGAIVFSIKTYLWKLSELVKHPVALDALLLANDNLAPLMFKYRAESLPTFRDFLTKHRPAESK